MEAVVALFVTVVFVTVVLGLAGMSIVRSLIHICGPNEVLVFSGSGSRVGDTQLGYRIVKGGMSLRRPFIERVERMDLTNMAVEVTVSSAYSKGGIPLNVQGVANLKVAGHQPALNNALQRFLGRGRDEIIRVAKDTLEGNLRGVLSQLTPEEVNNDKLAFAEKLLDEAEHDLTKLGLTLDTLKIQNVSDDVGYLDSIGRRQTADLQRRARTAEAQAKAETRTQDAHNRQAARVAEAQADKDILRAQTERRVAEAQSRRLALVAEETGRVTAAVAKAEADLKVQQARVEQVRRQLVADVVAPARADMERMISEARARSSFVVEGGKADALVLEELIRSWQAGGDAARDIFLMQKLQAIIGRVVETIQPLQVDRITVLPGAGRAVDTVRLVEEVKAATGVDVPQVLKGFAVRPT